VLGGAARPAVRRRRVDAGGLNSFYLIADEPEVYGLPRDPNSRRATSSRAPRYRPWGGPGRTPGCGELPEAEDGRACLTPFFTASPHWTWWIILYFFVGGIAGGAVMLATLLRLLGKPETSPSHDSGTIWASVCGRERPAAHDRSRAPAALSGTCCSSPTPGSRCSRPGPRCPWGVGLMLFRGFTFLAAAGAAAEEGWLPWPRLRILGEGALGRGIGVLASLFGLFLAGYTGVLLAVSNRPIWADSNWLGSCSCSRRRRPRRRLCSCSLPERATVPPPASRGSRGSTGAPSCSSCSR